MIDYHGDHIGLDVFLTTLAATAFPDAATAGARDRAVAAASGEDGASLLGAFVHQLLAHAAADGAELDLLHRAADLWQRGTGLCDRLGGLRADLESALEQPADPGSAAKFNAAAVGIQEFGNTLNAMRLEIDALRTDVGKFPHLPPHPRQRDERVEEWNWSDLTLGRRTDAFVRNLFRIANDETTLAFAVGATAAYGANVAGSAYLGHAVGGPRRSHRHRDRIARNATGSWLALHHPAARTPGQMRARVTFGPAGAPALPPALASLVADTLAATFDPARTPPAPDLDLGYRRLLDHLDLLDGFALPAVPSPPGQLWLASLYGDPQNPPPSLVPQDVDVVGQDGGGVAVTYGPSEPGSSTPNKSDSNSGSTVCGIIALVLIVLDLAQAFVQCIVQWANKEPCTFWQNMLLEKLWEKDPPDPRDPNGPSDPNVTAQQLTAMADSPQVAQLVGLLYDLHSRTWEAIDRAYVFLAVSGLIYPGHLVGNPVYAQFTALPPLTAWPHREEPDPVASYHRFPTAPLENPATTPSWFPAGSTPDVFLSMNTDLSAPRLSLNLWRQIARGEQDSQNHDLDADRGAAAPCWAAAGSVQDDPVGVVILGYDDF
ncbi:hypothetical protein ACQP2F_13515 [Actinoplanes sp. CA-030573]|uniref:hypothetical protein n=1 Tax=Actinoplanes sp. CA-030573 TaxID=3239898 RepID=UPI003D91F17D